MYLYYMLWYHAAKLHAGMHFSTTNLSGNGGNTIKASIINILGDLTLYSEITTMHNMYEEIKKKKH